MTAALSAVWLAALAAAPARAAAPKTLNQILRSPGPEIRESSSVPANCVSFWRGLEALDMNALAATGGTTTPPAPGDCAPPEALSRQQKAYASACRPLFAAGPRGPDSAARLRALNDCLIPVFRYRCAVTGWVTRDQRPSQIADLRVLADRLVGGLIDPSAPPAQELETALRMMQLAPDFLGPAKIASAIATGLALQERDAAAKAELLKMAADAYAVAHSLAPQDLEVEEVGLIARSGGFADLERLKTDAKALAAAHPKAGVGFYYVGYSFWKKGDVEGARRNLKKAAQLQPGEARFVRTLKDLDAWRPGMPKEIFEADFNIDILKFLTP